MDSNEVNKVLGAVLGTLTFAMGLGIVSDAWFRGRAPAKQGYELPAPETTAATATGPAAAAEEPIAVRLASADATRGQAVFRQCVQCHSIEKGGPNKVGPNLWGVVMGPKAHIPGFGYSAALKSKGNEAWTYDNLDAFLLNPRGYLPGTSMSFAGLSRGNQRADVIAYLRDNADTKAPLPEAPAATPAAAGTAAQPPAATPGAPTAVTPVPGGAGAAPSAGGAPAAPAAGAPAAPTPAGQAAPASPAPGAPAPTAPTAASPAAGSNPAPADAVGGNSAAGANRSGPAPGPVQ